MQLKWLERPPERLEAPLGAPLQVACRADGSPKPLATWTRLADEPSGDLAAPPLGEPSWPELRFHSISARDSGLYECRAGNGLERDLVARTRINVLGK